MSLRGEIIVNTRSLSAGLTGVQRYLNEQLRYLDDRVRKMAPNRSMPGIGGHIWEQAILPSMVGRSLLWSPANSGPIMVTRQVVTVHDVACLDHPEWFSSRFARWYRWMIPSLVRRVRSVITVSEFTKRRLVALTGVDDSKIIVVPNGVAQRFKPRPAAEIERVSKDLGIPAGRYFLSLGTLEPRKNIKLQIDAWSNCVPHLPQDVWLVIAGAIGSRKVFGDFRLGELPSRVCCIGFVGDDKLPALYSGCVALLYPSVYEGFGLPALEAMATGSVAIVSGSGALPEVVGNAAIMVDASDAGALARAMLAIVNNTDFRRELSARALDRARLFSWKKTSEMTWRILQQALLSPISTSGSEFN